MQLRRTRIWVMWGMCLCCLWMQFLWDSAVWSFSVVAGLRTLNCYFKMLLLLLARWICLIYSSISAGYFHCQTRLMVTCSYLPIGQYYVGQLIEVPSRKNVNVTLLFHFRLACPIFWIALWTFLSMHSFQMLELTSTWCTLILFGMKKCPAVACASSSTQTNH